MMLLDKDIREPLFEFLEERYGKVRILEEKTVGHSRADVVMVIPEKIVGIEIKSDADTYTRLERQVADYDLYFDANIVVVGSSHASHVAEHVPAHWGIVSVEQQEDHVDFYIVREMQDNPYAQLLRTIRVLCARSLPVFGEIRTADVQAEKQGFCPYNHCRPVTGRGGS